MYIIKMIGDNLIKERYIFMHNRENVYAYHPDAFIYPNPLGNKKIPSTKAYYGFSSILTS